MYSLTENEEINKEESKTEEFKAHAVLSYSQMTARCIEGHKFQPASRTLCAFLNINKLCHLYLGIKDDGTVRGHPMFRAQKEHFQEAIDKLLRKTFVPPVDDYRYAVNFIKVKPADETAVYSDITSLTIKQEHKLLELPNVCWCEKEISEHLKNTLKHPPRYVIHVQINEWDSTKDSKGFKVWPYFTSEEGKCFTRFSGSNHEFCPEQVFEQTMLDIEHCRSKKSL